MLLINHLYIFCGFLSINTGFELKLLGIVEPLNIVVKGFFYIYGNLWVVMVVIWLWDVISFLVLSVI